MASILRISMSTTTSVLLILVLALYVSVQVAVADDELIRKTCHNAEVPETCIQCVKSDSRSEQADAVLLAAIVVDCGTTHADILRGNMSALASEAKDHDTKKLFENCRILFSYAKDNLIYAATLILKNGDYNMANRAVFTAVRSRVACGESIDQIVPQKVKNELKIYDVLTEAAFKIISSLK